MNKRNIATRPCNFNMVCLLAKPFQKGKQFLLEENIYKS